MPSIYNRPHNGADAKDVLTPVVGDGAVHFDPEENRNDVFSESVVPRNTITHVPYRGNEQHGVEFNTPAGDFQPYASEQAAQEKAIDDTTPRDLVPVKPIPVRIVQGPNQLEIRKTRYQNVPLPYDPAIAANVSIVQVAQYDPQRTRLVIRAYAVPGATAATVVLTNDPNINIDRTSLSMPPSGGTVFGVGTAGLQLLDTTSHDAFYMVVMSVTGGTQSYANVMTEYQVFDGMPLL